MPEPTAGALEPLVLRLLERVEAVGRGLLLVCTGAGASRASGVPTFRGSEPEAVWRQEDRSLATRQTLETDPVAQWRWYLRRFERLEAARPNAGHRALVELERWQRARGGEFLLVTQNIDTLHEQAGARTLIKVHGTSDRVRCSRYGCRLGAPAGSLPRSEIELDPFRESPTLDHLPTCPDCGALLRAHVLFFDEVYDEHLDYRFDEVLKAADEAALVLFVGTSFAVGVTDLLVRSASRRAVPRLSIDPAGARLPRWSGVEPLAAAAEELLPALCARLPAGSLGPSA